MADHTAAIHVDNPRKGASTPTPETGESSEEKAKQQQQQPVHDLVYEVTAEDQQRWSQKDFDETLVRLQSQVRRFLAEQFAARKRKDAMPKYECIAKRDNAAATRIQALVRRRKMAEHLTQLRRLRDLQRLDWWKNVDGSEREEGPLFVAAHTGKLLQIETILGDQAKRANSRVRAGLKPGNIGPNQVLLGKCPEPRREGSTPLIVAARAGQLPAMALLLEKKANVDTRNASGDAALHVAIQSAVEKLAELKSAQIKSGDAKTSNNSVPSLSQKAESAVLDTEATAFLIDHKASVNAPDGNGRPPLHVAVFSNDEAIIGYLLEVKANANGVDSDDATPLHVAAFNGNALVTKTLLNHNANPDSVDADGATPLFYASARGHSDVVSVLLDAGADIDLREGDCDTPYANACHVLLTAAPHMPRAA
eukprot:INCI4805.4.p1 GENE.INCI4805.4~~INCI4805.4.p1  ORF type:complete len:437 (+),score=86.29 INCI4805.4:43-1311(+)